MTKLNKEEERKILIRRFFWKDRYLYQLGKELGIAWFDQFDRKFAKDEYAYFSPEEKVEAIEKIAKEVPSDERFIQAVNKVWERIPSKDKYVEVSVFIGRHYFYDEKEGKFKLENRQAELKKQVLQALEETGEGGKLLLMAIIELHKEGKWDKAYGGASWVDILAKIRELKGKLVYPSPRHLAILKSYRIYFRTGSRRYPTHTIPEEMIPVIEEILKKKDCDSGNCTKLSDAPSGI